MNSQLKYYTTTTDNTASPNQKTEDPSLVDFQFYLAILNKLTFLEEKIDKLIEVLSIAPKL